MGTLGPRRILCLFVARPPVSVLHRILVLPSQVRLTYESTQLDHSTSGSSTCLVVAWPSVPPTGQTVMASMCVGWRSCVALVLLKESDTMEQQIKMPLVQLRFSLGLAWVMIKRIQLGFIVRLQCGQKIKHWMHYDEISYYASGYQNSLTNKYP